MLTILLHGSYKYTSGTGDCIFNGLDPHIDREVEEEQEMRVNSTGLGATTMVADFEGFQTAVTEKLKGQYIGKDGQYIVLGVEAVKPVHWTIRITMDGRDLRNLIRHALKPKIVLRVLSILVRGSKID